jgi:hypothetical protein
MKFLTHVKMDMRRVYAWLPQRIIAALIGVPMEGNKANINMLGEKV